MPGKAQEQLASPGTIVGDGRRKPYAVRSSIRLYSSANFGRLSVFIWSS
jgi:hypothetical protein